MDFTPQGTDTYLPTSQADASLTTAPMVSASAAALVTGLCRMGNYFASQLSHVLDKIQPSLNLVKCKNFGKKRNITRVVRPILMPSDSQSVEKVPSSTFA